MTVQVNIVISLTCKILYETKTKLVYTILLPTFLFSELFLIKWLNPRVLLSRVKGVSLCTLSWIKSVFRLFRVPFVLGFGNNTKSVLPYSLCRICMTHLNPNLLNLLKSPKTDIPIRHPTKSRPPYHWNTHCQTFFSYNPIPEGSDRPNV